VPKARGRRSRPPTDRDQRLEYFDRAGGYTPYLATEAGGALFLVRTEDKHIGRSLFSKRGRGELGVLARAVAAVSGVLGQDAIAGSTFLDVGANIGTTTVPALRVHAFGSAVAIEPEPENVLLLRLNVLLNDLESRVTVLPLAASSEVGSSDLVVNRSRGGKHWIASDPGKLGPKRRADDTLLTVETVTLDHLVETGVLDPERTGLVWMDAEAHEGHILQGASSLLARGIPLVLEWNPLILDRVGDRGMLERAVAAEYTHFAALHRSHDPGGPRFPLQPVDTLPAYAERFLDRARGLTKTDILVMRLIPEQAAALPGLDAFIEPSDDERVPSPADRGGAGLLARLRDRRTRP
jgi:FkbM family methyltransferase